jgi:hypothetical protein
VVWLRAEGSDVTEVAMFHSLSGFKAQYHSLTLLVGSEFNEWRVLLYAPGVTIQGARQFSEAKAKEHALAVARSYVQDETHQDLPALPDVEWVPLAHDDWLIWRG